LKLPRERRVGMQRLRRDLGQLARMHGIQRRAVATTHDGGECR